MRHFAFPNILSTFISILPIFFIGLLVCGEKLLRSLELYPNDVKMIIILIIMTLLIGFSVPLKRMVVYSILQSIVYLLSIGCFLDGYSAGWTHSNSFPDKVFTSFILSLIGMLVVQVSFTAIGSAIAMSALRLRLNEYLSRRNAQSN